MFLSSRFQFHHSRSSKSIEQKPKKSLKFRQKGEIFSDRFFTRKTQPQNQSLDSMVDHLGDKGPGDINKPLEDSLEGFVGESGTNETLENLVLLQAHAAGDTLYSKNEVDIT